MLLGHFEYKLGDLIICQT